MGWESGTFCAWETTEQGSQKKQVFGTNSILQKIQRPNQLKYSAFSEKNEALKANTNSIEAQSN